MQRWLFKGYMNVHQLNHEWMKLIWWPWTPPLPGAWFRGIFRQNFT